MLVKVSILSNSFVNFFRGFVKVFFLRSYYFFVLAFFLQLVNFFSSIVIVTRVFIARYIVDERNCHCTACHHHQYRRESWYIKNTKNRAKIFCNGKRELEEMSFPSSFFFFIGFVKVKVFDICLHVTSLLLPIEYVKISLKLRVNI